MCHFAHSNVYTISVCCRVIVWGSLALARATRFAFNLLIILQTNWNLNNTVMCSCPTFWMQGFLLRTVFQLFLICHVNTIWIYVLCIFGLRGGWEGSSRFRVVLLQHMLRASFISGSPAQKGRAAFVTPSQYTFHGQFCAGFAVGCAFTICAIFIYLLQLDHDWRGASFQFSVCKSNGG